jgi:hypothetical protein
MQLPKYIKKKGRKWQQCSLTIFPFFSPKEKTRIGISIYRKKKDGMRIEAQ